jgi:hypothetical protein
MLDFLGFIATAALMVLAVSAVITFINVSPNAKLILATLAGLWIGIAAAAGSAGTVAISKPIPVVGLFVAVPLVFVPTVLVPFWLILHAIIWAQLRRLRRLGSGE